MANTYLTHTPSNGGTPGTQKFTLSFWIKRSKLGSTQRFLGAYSNDNLNTNVTFISNDKFQFYNRNTNAGDKYFVTNRLFRDTNAWYHFVIAIDTTLSTEADRVKFYVNGVEETSFAEVYEPTQNYEYRWGEALPMNIGVRDATNSDFFSGSISHFHYIDGTQYAASDFGETDATTGEWKIKTSPNVTYGNDGYFILKDGNSVTDQSGNGNNFTVAGGTLTKTEDCPSNVFATFNPLSGADTMAVNSTFANGNNKVTCSGSVYNPFPNTIGVNSGKYYAEFKLKSPSADAMIGIFAKYGASGNYLGSQAYQYCWYNDSGRIIGNNANIQTGVGQYTTNDIIGIALDCTNNKLYFHKNGTYITNGSGTGNPSSGTYGYSITDPDSTDLGFYFMTALDWGGTNRAIWEANFGNGYFSNNAVSSAGTNASGNGIFEYDVPTGFTALSTKGLNL